MQDDVVDHIALVFSVIEAEGAAQVFVDVNRGAVVVAGLHVHSEGMPRRHTHRFRTVSDSISHVMTSTGAMASSLLTCCT